MGGRELKRLERVKMRESGFGEAKAKLYQGKKVPRKVHNLGGKRHTEVRWDPRGGRVGRSSGFYVSKGEGEGVGARDEGGGERVRGWRTGQFNCTLFGKSGEEENRRGGRGGEGLFVRGKTNKRGGWIPLRFRLGGWKRIREHRKPGQQRRGGALRCRHTQERKLGAVVVRTPAESLNYPMCIGGESSLRKGGLMGRTRQRL